jgi:hypothetical protein
MKKISKGWFRLLIVITAFWVVVVCGLVLSQYLSRNPFDQFPDGREPPEYFFWHWSPIDLFAPKNEQIRQFEPNLLKIIVWIFSPVSVLWLSAYSWAWVRDGFKS